MNQFDCRLCNDEGTCEYKTGAVSPCAYCNIGEWELFKHKEDKDLINEKCQDCNSIVSTGKPRCLPCHKTYGQKMVLCSGCYKNQHKGAYPLCYYCNLKKKLRK
tara:strand:- start:1373 stop:1684 length:312 start_codon:yes stop_codon:yes gene_type:complete